MIVRSVQELVDKLKGYVDEQNDIEDLYRGQVNRNKKTFAAFAADEEMAKTIDAWVSKGKYSKLLDLWVNGLSFDWSKLYGDTKPQRVSLPTYPFDKERYWIREQNQHKSKLQYQTIHSPVQMDNSGKIVLKSLNSVMAETHNSVIEQNSVGESSPQTGHLFQKTITIDNDILLREHLVFGHHVLSTDSLLEIICHRAMSYYGTENLDLRQINISHPVIGIANKETKIRLTFIDNDGLPTFEMRSYIEGVTTTWNKNIEGVIYPHQDELTTYTVHRDILHTYEKKISIEQLFDERYPLQTGDFFRSLKEVHFQGEEAVGTIQLSKAARKSGGDYSLHPSIVDGVLACVVSLAEHMDARFFPSKDTDFASYTFIPISIDQVQITGKLTESSYYGHVKLLKQEFMFSRFDVRLINEQGKVVLLLQGLDERKIRREDIERSLRRLSAGLNPSSQGSIIRPDSIRSRQSISDKTDEIHTAEDHQRAIGKDSRHQLLNQLRTLGSQVLMIEKAKIEPNKNLMELGLDSILSTEFVKEINKHFNTQLRGTAVYEYPTLEKLAGYMEMTCVTLLSAVKKIHSGHSASKAQASATTPPRQTALKSITLEHSGPSPTVTIPAHSLTQGGDKRESRDIAVIGMACRFPQIDNIEDFWKRMEAGQYLITDVPTGRWQVDDEADLSTIYCRKGGFIKSFDQFDPLFFNISPREAESMDPQLRLLLEVSWEAIEDSGYAAAGLRGSQTGLYVGCCFNDYVYVLREAGMQDYHFSGTGNGASFLSNRVSYVLDLKGPSMTLDTACSSSLVALHLACGALRKGDIDQALVAGTNINCHPMKYHTFCAMGALSEHNELRPFDQAADGYIPGEGIAVLLLRRLDEAMAAGDVIHGVIKGTAVKHGGYSGGPTVPNVEEQTETMIAAWKDAGIKGKTLSYYEAHGTGTRLGDPLEIQAVKKALETPNSKPSACAVGTVKANMGHTEATAGLAGVIKVLLMMKHKQIPVLPKLDRLNPMIDFANSGLYINPTAQSWASQEENPRRAGVSSFGMGGTFAHAVIEEYVEKGTKPQRYKASKAIAEAVPLSRLHGSRNNVGTEVPVDDRMAQIRDQSSELENKDPYLIVLSAKNADRLKEVARNLHTFLSVKRGPETWDLHEVAYTLQVGREAMEERLGMIIKSQEELIEQLRDFLEGKETIEGFYRGHVKRNKDTLALFTVDEELQEAIGKWIQRGKYSNLLDLWVKGLVVDWHKLYGESKPRRISLPTYPFARERYWIEKKGVNGEWRMASGEVRGAERYLHPLVHENTSTLEEQRFSSTFTGEEFYLKDHQVNGEKILPVVAYLEMAQEAVMQALGGFSENNQTIQLKNIVWARPIVVDDRPCVVNVGLFSPEDGEIAYEIYTDNLNQAESCSVHCQGVAKLVSPSEVRSLNLSELQKKLNQNGVSAQACYEAFKGMGIDYGPALQGLEKIYVGANKVLVKLTLPASVSETKGQFNLHPSLLISALQTSFIGLEKIKNYYHPIALEELEIGSFCTSRMWAWIHLREDSAQHDQKKLDIFLVDEQGEIRVKMSGLELKSQDVNAEVNLSPMEKQLLFTKEEWISSPIPHHVDWVDCLRHYAGKGLYVLYTNQKDRDAICGLLKDLEQAADLPNSLHIHAFHIDKFTQISLTKAPETIFFFGPELNEDQSIHPIQSDLTKVLFVSQYIMKNAWNDSIRIYYLYESDFTKPRLDCEALSGFLKSAMMENPRHVWKCIGSYDEHTTVGRSQRLLKEWLLDIHKTSPVASFSEVRYQNSDRLVPQQRETNLSRVSYPIFRSGGTYLITGGLGPVGELLCNELGKRYQPTLVILSRGSWDEKKQEQCRKLKSTGSKVYYYAVDVADKAALQETFGKIKQKVKAIHG